MTTQNNHRTDKVNNQLILTFESAEKAHEHLNPVALVDSDNMVLSANKAFYAHFGYEDLMSEITIDHIFIEKETPRYSALNGGFIATRAMAIHQHGSVSLVGYKSYPININGKHYKIIEVDEHSY